MTYIIFLTCNHHSITQQLWFNMQKEWKQLTYFVSSMAFVKANRKDNVSCLTLHENPCLWIHTQNYYNNDKNSCNNTQAPEIFPEHHHTLDENKKRKQTKSPVCYSITSTWSWKLSSSFRRWRKITTIVTDKTIQL